MEDTEKQLILRYKQIHKKAVTKLFCPSCDTNITDEKIHNLTNIPSPYEFDYAAYERGKDVYQGHYTFKYVICPKCNEFVEVNRWEDMTYMY